MTTPPLIILAAGEGKRLRPYTKNRPKCMVPLAGRPLIHWQIAAAQAARVKQIRVVGGYRIDRLDVPEEMLIENLDYAATNMIVSLLCAEPIFGSSFISSYGDIVYDPSVLRSLLRSKHDISVVVDRQWRSYWDSRSDNILGDAESLVVDERGSLASIGQKVTNVSEIEGQYIGLVSFRGEGIAHALDLLDREREVHGKDDRLMCTERPFPELYMTDLLQGLINDGADVRPVWIDGGWLEIDTIRDLTLAEKLVEVDEGMLRINR